MHSNERKVPVHVSQRGIEERKNFNKRTNSRIYLECQINQVKHCKNTYFGVYLKYRIDKSDFFCTKHVHQTTFLFIQLYTNKNKYMYW